MVPKTIENTREADETVCRPDDEEVKFSTFCVLSLLHVSMFKVSIFLQLFADIDADEFNPVLRREVTPKVLITTCRFNSTVSLFL